jgi:ribosomal RNA assembly protein
MQFVRIPEERVSVLIGSGGETKRMIEARTNCRLSISDGEVSVEGEPLDEWAVRDIVHAIGRGFSPDKAVTLKNDGYVFEYIELEEFAGSQKSRARLKGRVIGEDGRTRRHIERTSGAMISVYGKTVGFIGPYDSVSMAKEAVTMLLNGSRHQSVYKMMEKRAKTLM